MILLITQILLKWTGRVGDFPLSSEAFDSVSGLRAQNINRNVPDFKK